MASVASISVKPPRPAEFLRPSIVIVGFSKEIAPGVIRPNFARLRLANPSEAVVRRGREGLSHAEHSHGIELVERIGRHLGQVGSPTVTGGSSGGRLSVAVAGEQRL